MGQCQALLQIKGWRWNTNDKHAFKQTPQHRCFLDDDETPPAGTGAADEADKESDIETLNRLFKNANDSEYQKKQHGQIKNNNTGQDLPQVPATEERIRPEGIRREINNQHNEKTEEI